MKRRVLAALLVSALTIASVVGCGSKTSETKTEETKTEDAKADDKGSDLGTITVVTGASGEPYSLMDDSGSRDSWTGIDAEMWAEIEKRTGWKVDVKRTAFESLWGELDTGRADIAANCFAVKKERTDKYLASIPYYGDSQNVIVNEGSDIKSFDDLKGKKVGYKTGQAAQTFIDDNQAKYGYEVVAYEDSAIGMSDLGNGRIDAFANTRTNINQFLNGNPQFKFQYFDEDLTANNVAYFMPKTERGEQIKAELDKVLQEMLDDGTVSKITEKWLFSDMTKLIQK